MTLDKSLHPGGNPGANLGSISHRCHAILVSFIQELTHETIHLLMGCRKGGSQLNDGKASHHPGPWVLEDIRDVFQRIRLARVPCPSAGSTHVSAPETCRPYDAVPRTLHSGTFPSYTSTYPVRRRQQSTLALHHGFRISDTHLLLGLRVDRSEDGRGRRRGGRVRARGPLSHARRKGCSREFLLPGEGGEVSARAARWCTAPRC